MNRYEGIDKRIIANVRMYAKILKRKPIFRSMDLEDLEQELMCEAISSLRSFDERRGELGNFIRKVLSRRCVNLTKTYTCKKRNSNTSPLDSETELLTQCEVFDNYRDMCEKRIEVSQLINELPIKYRLVYKLLQNHSIAETTKILGVSRSVVFRSLKKITYLFQCWNNSQDSFSFFYNLRRNCMGKNLSVIETLDVKELSRLQVYDLADLCDQVSKLLSHAKELKEKLDDALNLRFSETIKDNLRRENKDTGTTKFIENGFQIVAEVPKKVTWDSQLMEEIIKTIPEAHRRDYIKTTYSIDERKYAYFTPEYQQLFKPARTITPGKVRFKISIPEGE